MAARKTPLRAVKNGEPTSGKAKPLTTVADAAQDGNQLDLLVALRNRIARSITDPQTPPRDLAALSRRLLEIAKEIDAIRAADGEGDEVGNAAATPDEDWSAI